MNRDTRQTLRKWVRQHEIDNSEAPGMTIGKMSSFCLSKIRLLSNSAKAPIIERVGLAIGESDPVKIKLPFTKFIVIPLLFDS